MVVIAGATGSFIDSVVGLGFGAFSSSIMVAGGILPATVVATVNLAKVGTGLFSGMAHWRFGNVRWNWVLPLAIPGIAGGISGAMLLTHLPQEVARVLVPWILLAMGILMLRRFLFISVRGFQVAGGSHEASTALSQGKWHEAWQAWTRVLSNVWLCSIGFVAGFLNALSGAFGPFATSSVLLLKRGHPRFAIGTVNFVEFFVAGAIAVTLLWQLNWGSFRWGLPLALMSGSVLTAPLGAYLSRRIPARSLGVVVGSALIVVNLWSILKGAI